jgi:type II secretory ATPase GspE/PulE/Tfp pilus assembly ATPase PilB-like protein
LYEIFEISPEARRLMEKDASSGELRELRKRSGETTLFEEGMLAARGGQTSLEEVLRVAWAPAEEKQ